MARFVMIVRPKLKPAPWIKRLATCENCGRTFLASAGRSTCCSIPKESESK